MKNNNPFAHLMQIILAISIIIPAKINAQWTDAGAFIHPTTNTDFVLMGTSTITDTEKQLLINSANLGTGEFGGIALIGANEEIYWRSSANQTSNAHLRFDGSDLEVASFSDDVEVIATDEVQFFTNTSTNVATLMGSSMEIRGRLDLQRDSVGNTLMNARGKEAIWYNGEFFSWGFGGEWNRIADEVAIGAIGSEPAFMLEVAGDVNISGELTADSDVRLKKNIEQLQPTIIDKLMKLNPVKYDFRTDEYPNLQLSDRKKMGFIAQEMNEIFPELVSEGTETTSVTGEQFDVLSVNYVELIPALVKAIQDQQQIINDLEQRLNDVEANTVRN